MERCESPKTSLKETEMVSVSPAAVCAAEGDRLGEDLPPTMCKVCGEQSGCEHTAASNHRNGGENEQHQVTPQVLPQTLLTGSPGEHRSSDGQGGDWEEKHDPESDRMYYHNRITGDTTWERHDIIMNSNPMQAKKQEQQERQHQLFAARNRHSMEL